MNRNRKAVQFFIPNISDAKQQKGVHPRNQLKKCSVLSATSSTWIESTIQQDTTHTRRLHPFCINDDIESENAMVSPFSSPECDQLTDFGHECLAIDITEERENTPEPFIIDEISDSGSPQESPHDHTLETFGQFKTNPLCLDQVDYIDFQYMDNLHCDVSSVPYLNLTFRPASSKKRSKNNELVSRLRALVRRNYSQRAIWLHRYRESKDHDKHHHPSRLCHVVQCSSVVPQSSGLSGATMACRVRWLELPDPDSIVLLPMSVGVANTEQPLLLGDSVTAGQILRLFQPWCTVRDTSDVSVLHSFFWVERVSDLTDVEYSSQPSSAIHKLHSSLIACSCFGSESRLTVLSCLKRFRNSVSRNLDYVENFTSSEDHIIVLDSCLFWILNKLRRVLLVLFRAGHVGLILLSSDGEQMQRGSVYTLTTGLLSLPLDQLSSSLLNAVARRLDETQGRLNGASLNRMSVFCGREIEHLSADCVKSMQLYDTRSAVFRLVRMNYLRFTPCTPIPPTDRSMKRCYVEGTFLFEVPAGSVLLLSNRFRRLMCGISDHQLDEHIARLFFLLLDPDSPRQFGHVVACICSKDILSPTDLILNRLTSERSNVSVDRVMHTGGIRVQIDQAIWNLGFLMLDHFSMLHLPSGETGFATDRIPWLLPSLFTSFESHSIVRISGLITAVHTRMSHSWSICPQCLSADLILPPFPASRFQPLHCSCCSWSAGSTGASPCQLFEVLVTLRLDPDEEPVLEDPLSVNRSTCSTTVIMKLASSRLLNLLGTSIKELTQGPQLDPVALLHKRVHDACCLWLRNQQCLLAIEFQLEGVH